MLSKKWYYSPSDYKLQRILSDSLGFSPVTAQLLINRGVRTVADAKQFLQPQLSSLSDPLEMAGMKKACQRIDQALQKNEKIIIYGDYDVDGVVGTVLLVNLFKLMGRSVDFYIPHRIEEGYSLNRQAIDKFIKDKVDLVVTVDCGVSSIDEVTYAQKQGLDIIVTDHHRCGAKLPEAVAVINPMIATAGNEVRPLSGVAVAFKLVWAITQGFSSAKKSSREFHDFLMESMSLVALGTIADVTPLTFENRILTSYGLQSLAQTKIPGLKALMEQCRLRGTNIITSDISFRIAPRLNAGGRLGSARMCVELFLSSSEQRIEEIINDLEGANRRRQKIQKEILKDVQMRVEVECDLEREKVIVLAGKDWHPGVIGIVAARIAEEYYRPTFLISVMGESGKGSGRSIPSFHLYDALAGCQELLISFGGHAYAAGVEIDQKMVPRLKEKLDQQARKQLSPEDLIPTLGIDAEIPFVAINRPLLGEIAHLAPFGESNPEPVFSTSKIEVAGTPKLMGRNNNDLAFFAKQQNQTFRAVGFRMGGLMDALLNSEGKDISIVYNLKLNRWRGEESIELILKDVKIVGK